MVLHLGAHDLFVCIVLYTLFILDMVSYVSMNAEWRGDEVELKCIHMMSLENGFKVLLIFHFFPSIFLTLTYISLDFYCHDIYENGEIVK